MPSFAKLVLYNSEASTDSINIYSTYEQRTLDEAITSFRLVSAAQFANIFIEYCYVDFERRWETTHSTSPAQIIKVKMLLLGKDFDFAVIRYVNATEEGVNWFARTKNAYVDHESELAH
ncbi:hypothetical protein THRCLA_20394 [Thraustotheca clavata]|uniref:Uncharacterized protein n=1 Tax=Thraustotheca clavata TaxID=74557 RepID=A0A1W0A863_9STRA|nr:hypothetical protein THRCLA_20394 [Thraustotheca clavata]